jgi:hypothetical protein
MILLGLMAVYFSVKNVLHFAWSNLAFLFNGNSQFLIKRNFIQLKCIVYYKINCFNLPSGKRFNNYKYER